MPPDRLRQQLLKLIDYLVVGEFHFMARTAAQELL